MTRDEIKKIEHMWKIASNNPHHDTNWYDPTVVKFAELVRADEREVRSVRWDEYIAKAIAAEREACAKVCDGLADMHAKMNQWGSHKTADTLAQAIRAGAIHDKT